jgi:hypothetical protein
MAVGPACIRLSHKLSYAAGIGFSQPYRLKNAGNESAEVPECYA